MLLWRISDFADLSGRGGEQASGRWNIAGRPIVYTAESSALAMLEILVGVQVDLLPVDYQLLRIEGPDDAPIATFDPGGPPDIGSSQAWGDEWLASGRTALARVPSAIAPYSFNWLLNPAHPDARSFAVVARSRWPWDRRLFS